jgi:hypothetical protein
VREYQQERLSDILGEKDSGAGAGANASGSGAGLGLGVGLAQDATSPAPLRAQ